MLKWLLYCFLALSVIAFSACNLSTQNESANKVELVISEFKKAEIPLGEKQVKSKTFDFVDSDEKNYGFSGGTIYLIYNYKDKDVIVEKVRSVLTEAEFQYPLETLYTNDFCIVFAPISDDPEIEQKINSVLQKLEELEKE